MVTDVMVVTSYLAARIACGQVSGHTPSCLVVGAIVYSPFMTENRRELPTTVGIVGIAKTVALHRLAMTRENHQKRPTGNLVFCRF
jgi:hypothetical protein